MIKSSSSPKKSIENDDLHFYIECHIITTYFWECNNIITTLIVCVSNCLVKNNLSFYRALILNFESPKSPIIIWICSYTPLRVSSTDALFFFKIILSYSRSCEFYNNHLNPQCYFSKYYRLKLLGQNSHWNVVEETFW